MNRKIDLVIILLILTLSEVTTAQTKWDWISGGSDASNFVKCTFVNERVGFAIDSLGLVLKTTDGGASFKLIPIQLSNTLTDICAVDTMYAYLLTAEGIILKTTDGGENWQSQYEYKLNYGRSLSFSDRNNGWLCANEFIYKTTNGGKSWINCSPELDQPPTIVLSFDSLRIVSAAKNSIYRTSDGGRNWQKSVIAASNTINRLFFIDRLNGWLSFSSSKLSDSSGLMRTTDGGITWSVVSKGSFFRYCMGFSFKNNMEGFAINYNEKILKSTDGGLTWTQSYAGNGQVYKSIAVKGPLMLVAGKDGVMLRSTDGGNNWNRINLIDYLNYYGVQFFDSSVGIIVGSQGTILRTENGGLNWSPVASSVNQNLTTIFLLNSEIGWVAGVYGTLLKTTNKGLTWDRINHTIRDNITSIFFVSEAEGWFATGEGGIYKTTDGGASWNIKQTIYTRNSPRVFFLNSRIGWITGDNWLYYTSNGGDNWSNIYQIGSSRLISVKFVNEHIGYAAVDGPYAGKTTDGGVTWEFTYLPGALKSNQVNITADGEIWLASKPGLIFRSTNEGVSWQKTTLNTLNDITDIEFVGGSAIAVGGRRMILHAVLKKFMLTSPKVNDKLPVGYQRNITWEAQSASTLNLDYSTDGGLSWLPIQHNYPAQSKSFSWTVPPYTSENCVMRVQVFDNNVLTDTQYRDFIIVNPKLTLVAPKDGYKWPINYMGKIRWQTSGVDKINVMVTRTDGLLWLPIVENYDALKEEISFNFVYYDTSSVCRIKITDAENNAISDSNFSYFSLIKPLPGTAFQVSPNNDTYNNQPVTLVWGNVSDADRYELILSGDADFSDYILRDTALTVTFKNLPTLPHNKTFYWRVISWNSSGPGSHRDRFFSTKVITIPAPTNLTATRTAPGTVELNWTDNSQNEEIFSIYRKNGPANSSQPFTYLNSMFANITSCIDGTLSDTATYSYVVHGKNQNIFSPASNTVTVYPPAAIGEGIEIPKDFELYQNYPNPFNPVTTIRYGVPSAGNVTLEVFDPLGRKISTPVNGYVQAGYYTVSVKPEKLSSGVYIYVLKANGNTTGNPVRIIKKMLYLR